MASLDENSAHRFNLLILLVLTVATVAKIAWAANSIGTTDTVRFFHFGEALLAKPMAEVYAEDSRWNQTVAVSWLMRGLVRLTQDDGDAFVLWFRMPGILADIAVVIELLLLRRALGLHWGWLAFAAASPINLIVCGFHGNLDGLVAAGMFLAFSAAVRGCPMLSGVWLGLACNVKVAPVILAPALAAFWLTRGGFWRYGASFGIFGALMVGSGIAAAGFPFVKHVLAYNSVWGFWGIPEILTTLGLSAVEVPLGAIRTQSPPLSPPFRSW